MDLTINIEYKNNKLKELREKSGLSQSQLAKLSGVNVRVLQNYEQGARNLNGAKLNTLLLFCKALNCKLHDLVTDPQTLELLSEVYPHDA